MLGFIVRSKCKFVERAETEWGGVRLKFISRPDPTIPEKERVSKDSNSGYFEVTLKNDDPAALRFPSSALGQEFSFEIHPLPPPQVEVPAEPGAAVNDAPAAAVPQPAVAPVAAAPAEAAPAPVAAPQPVVPAAAPVAPATAQGTT